MNKELLEKVMAHIQEEPRRLDMHVWGQAVDPLWEDHPPCGTVACIAGWTNVLTGEEKPFEPGFEGLLPLRRAAGHLGLNEDEARRLFLPHRWPQTFEYAYDDAETPQARAEVTFARIRHFIQTEGRE